MFAFVVLEIFLANTHFEMCKKIASENRLKMHVCRFRSFSILITGDERKWNFHVGEMEKSLRRESKCAVYASYWLCHNVVLMNI